MLGSWALHIACNCGVLISQEHTMAIPDIHLYTASTMNGWKPII
jgi:hypothetical protein